MVSVPRYSGDSGYHRESQEDEEVSIKLESRMEASSEAISPTTLLNEEESAERQSVGRSFADRNEEEDLFEEKSQPPPYASSGGTADHDVNRGPPGEERKVKTEGTPPTTAPLSQKSLKKKKPKASRKELKAPADSDSDSRDEIAATWSDDQLEEVFNRNELQVFLAKNLVMKILQLRTPGSLKGPMTPSPATTNKLDAVKAVLRLLKDAGITPGSFAAKDLFHLDLEAIQITLLELFEKLKVLVREAETQTKVETKLEAPLIQLPGSASPTGSSQQLALCLGPSGAAMLHTRSQRVSNEGPWVGVSAAVSRPNENPDRLQTFFNSAMERFLKEQRAAQGTPKVPLARRTEPQDVDMDSVGSDHGEYDPDDLDIPAPRQATVATAATATWQPAITPRIRVSAMSELKEFSRKDDEEDRARAWIGKVKSAFVRDQAPDDEKCLVLGGLFTGPVRNCSGDSASRSRDNTTMRGSALKLRVKSGPSNVRREHIEHFIETLDDRDQADQLALLRISGADALEEVLRTRQRAKNRQGCAHFRSSKYRQKAAGSNATKSAPTRKVQAVVTTNQPDSDSDSGLSGSESDGDLRRIYLASTEGESKTQVTAPNEPDRTASGQTPPPRDASPTQRSPHGRPQFQRCTHCGSHRHDDLHCWKRLTCQRCGKRGHPSDRCLIVCRGCGEINDTGKCLMEEFYNLIRQWYDPAKHGGVLPESAEKMLN
ncbi:hypothetical protein F444_13291 [Phytophthora nicotianae P1976]|uniref:CCHC-type domain-containing protein n=1 Tax=Phytophthora nicotianae P1976 TaxID=1317066 RepID=A0A080ZU95_PHYNI|nr:hypothetical protein F444_13291 [Phytophthora nicotianae P1976]